MKKIDFDRLAENLRWPLLVSALLLIGAGLVTLYSTSGLGREVASNHFAKQMAFATLGVIGLCVFFFFDYRRLKIIAWPLFGVCIILLIAVKFVGITAGGAQRWLPLGPFRFQPSELTKVGLVLILAHLFARRSELKPLGFKDLGLPLLLILTPFVFILKQPDLGTAIHLLLTVSPIFLFVGLRKRVILTIIGLGAAAIIWIFFLGGQEFLLQREVIKPYHLARFRFFLAPKAAPTEQGWQIIQAESAIGSGQVFGQGFLEGSQHRYGFLPAPETDFAFAALAEEWGFVGASATLLLFFCLFCSALGVVRHSGEPFGAYLALGLISLIFWQMTINLAMVLGLFPVVGIPLPFISYGGSSLLTSLLAIGVLTNIGLNRFVFQDETVKPNPLVWEKASPPKVPSLAPVRRLGPPNPNEPEPYPDHRLTHREPWLKYRRKPFLPFFPPSDD
ncbi:MAG: rod shape-determining protein RodA [Deltaproteobacteria bacterium]|jgi:rod shape determining protein RodA|nr:rod shape-determining protein RodA [Deltaproteobacteria bacterium]